MKNTQLESDNEKLKGSNEKLKGSNEKLRNNNEKLIKATKELSGEIVEFENVKYSSMSLVLWFNKEFPEIYKKYVTKIRNHNNEKGFVSEL